MPPPATVDDFLQLAAKSGLLDERQLSSHLRNAKPGSPVPTAPDEAADYFVNGGMLTRFQADHLLQGKWARFFIGPYKVLGPIAAGGAGVVYLGEHRHMRRRVAVKVLLGSKSNDPASLERFYREARAIAALRHPNIVGGFDVGQDEHLHYLAMEYVDGASLKQIVRAEGVIAPILAADYLRQAALGFQHAHEAGLVHRDVKPSNLMVDRGGVVKILDLGLARFREDLAGDLTQGDVLGAVDYMAPEQALDSHTVDIRADIYSLGATIYYCLTGRKAPRAGVRAEQNLGLRTESAGELFELLDKMMAQEPEDRFQTPADVAAAAAAWLKKENERTAGTATATMQVGVRTVQSTPILPPAAPSSRWKAADTPPPKANSERRPAPPAPAPPEVEEAPAVIIRPSRRVARIRPEPSISVYRWGWLAAFVVGLLLYVLVLSIW